MMKKRPTDVHAGELRGGGVSAPGIGADLGGAGAGEDVAAGEEPCTRRWWIAHTPDTATGGG